MRVFPGLALEIAAEPAAQLALEMGLGKEDAAQAFRSACWFESGGTVYSMILDSRGEWGVRG